MNNSNLRSCWFLMFLFLFFRHAAARIPVIRDIGLLNVQINKNISGRCELELGIRMNEPVRYKLEFNGKMVRCGVLTRGLNRIKADNDIFLGSKISRYYLFFSSGSRIFCYRLMVSRKFHETVLNPIINSCPAVHRTTHCSVALEINGREIAEHTAESSMLPPAKRSRMREIIAAPGKPQGGVSISALYSAIKKKLRQRRYGPPPMKRSASCSFVVFQQGQPFKSVKADFTLHARAVSPQKAGEEEFPPISPEK